MHHSYSPCGRQKFALFACHLAAAAIAHASSVIVCHSQFMEFPRKADDDSAIGYENTRARAQGGGERERRV